MCNDAGDCVGAGVDGVCQPDGFCSFPDGECPSGQRYGAHSGSVSGECVQSGGTTTGSPPTDTTTQDPTTTMDPVTTLPLEASATADESTSAATTPSDTSTSTDPDSSDDGTNLDEDLLVWLSFDDATSEFANEGTLGGTASCNGNNCPTSSAGVVTNAMRFDGIDDCLSFASTPELESMEQLTVAAWIRVDGDAMFYAFVDKPVGDDFNNSWALYYYLSKNGEFELFAMTDGVAGNHLAALDPLPLGEWVHLVGTWDGEGMGLYIDGALLGIAPAPVVAFDAQPVLFGCDDDHDQAGPNGLLEGALDDVRVYARVLDAEDIAALADHRSP